MAVGNGMAFVIAGIVTASLIALFRKLRSGGESTEMKCGEQAVEKVGRGSKKVTERQSCEGCPDCEKRITPDPDDWFCDDEVTVVCKAVSGGYVMAKQIRPYLVHERCPVPQWCPKKKVGNQSDKVQGGRAMDIIQRLKTAERRKTGMGAQTRAAWRKMPRIMILGEWFKSWLPLGAKAVRRMARLAISAHEGQFRSGPGDLPYVVHPHAVVAMLKSWGYSVWRDPVTLAVAWGHDILEDTDTPEDAIRSVDDKLGERILDGIKMLTFKPNVPSGHPEYGRLKADYINQVANNAPPEIIVVKIADRLCNTIDMGNSDYARTYYGYGNPLFERIKDCKYANRIDDSRREVVFSLADFCGD